MIARWENHITLSYAKQSLLKFFITLLFTSHLMACIWGLLGNFFLDMECDENGEVSLRESRIDLDGS